MAGEVGVETPKVEETPEFQAAVKAAVKAEREALEQTIRESNAKHLEEERKKLEALYGPPGKTPEPAPTTGKDFFQSWGEKHGLPPESGLELSQGIIDYVNRTLIAPLSQSQRRAELRMQRQDVRSSDAQLSKLDDKYHEEVLKLLDTVKTIHADSYAAALELVIGKHFKDELEADRKTRGDGLPLENKPGPTPLPATPKPKGKLEVTAHQKERAEQMGLSEEAFIERIQTRVKGMKERGFSEASIRLQLGKDLGTLTV